MCEATERAELHLRTQRTAPGQARALAGKGGCADHALELLDDALLLIRELVTSSVVHGGPPVVLAIECDGAGPHVRVRDGAPEGPRPRQAGPDADDGRGMSLVELTASTRGVDGVADGHGVGMEVWFEKRRARPTSH